LQPLEAYVDRLHEIRGSKRGTPELSYRAALENLLNAIGADLEPCTRRRNWPTSAPAGPIFGLLEVKSGNRPSRTEPRAPDRVDLRGADAVIRCMMRLVLSREKEITNDRTY
jgi:hypothetical protein